jgi:hypothetical protein
MLGREVVPEPRALDVSEAIVRRGTHAHIGSSWDVFLGSWVGPRACFGSGWLRWNSACGRATVRSSCVDTCF